MLNVSAGWHAHLDVLAARLAGEEPEPFWDHWSYLRPNMTSAFRPEPTLPEGEAEGEERIDQATVGRKLRRGEAMA